MKKTLLFILFIACISAQSGLTFIGGLNMATIKYNDDDIGDQITVSSNMLVNVGVEKMVGAMMVGGAFVQRGAKIEMEILGIDVKGSDSYNYLSIYGIYPLISQQSFSAFGGLQVGYGIGGMAEIEVAGDSDSEKIDGDALALDYGLLLGADIMLNANMGIRASYYLGLADVSKDADSDLNFKNRGLTISILYKM